MTTTICTGTRSVAVIKVEMTKLCGLRLNVSYKSSLQEIMMDFRKVDEKLTREIHFIQEVNEGAIH